MGICPLSPQICRQSSAPTGDEQDTQSRPANEAELSEWARRELVRIFPHEATILGFGTVTATDLIVDRVICVNMTDRYVLGLIDGNHELRSAALRRWYRVRAPLWLVGPDWRGIQDRAWKINIERHGFTNCLVDGILAPIDGRFSFLTMFNMAGRTPPCGMAVRHFATALATDVWFSTQPDHQRCAQFPTMRLTAVEQELIQLLRLGKSNWEIGKILGKSAATVKTQLQRLYQRTGTANRTELAIRATVAPPSTPHGVSTEPETAGRIDRRHEAY